MCDAFGDLVEKQAKGCLFGGIGSQRVKVSGADPRAGQSALPVSEGLTGEQVTSVLIFIPLHSATHASLPGSVLIGCGREVQ